MERIIELRQEIKALKLGNHSELEISDKVKELQKLKTSFQQKPGFDRSGFEQVLTRKFFVIPSFEIYGGIAGLYDYGPPGCALQQNILSIWRQHFVLEEDMLELDCTNLTPESVLQTSGHVERFADYMVKDTVTGDIFRADHLVKAVVSARLDDDKNLKLGLPVKKRSGLVKQGEELSESKKIQYLEILETLDNYQGDELGKLIKDLDIRALETGNPVSDPVLFNLMFDTQIGPTGQFKGYLRPETAQGHFINFKRLLEFNNEQMPFSSATIGKSFRNEISPRQGLLRVREFTMCEIEHFVHPDRKNHPRFMEVCEIEMPLYSKEAQLNVEGASMVKIGDAVKNGIVDNETLGYFIARIYLFLLKIGIDPARIRFRQHMDNEMAHYASDCWDAEINSSYGWIESVGCADRSAYDLTCHSKKTGTKLIARETIPERIESILSIEINKKVFGPMFGKNGNAIKQALQVLEENKEELHKTHSLLVSNGKFSLKVSSNEIFEISKDVVDIKFVEKKTNVLEYTPNVIEPSFGVGRILYALLEHSYYVRDSDEQRAVFKFLPAVAPTKALVVPLAKDSKYDSLIKDIVLLLRKHNISNRVDNSSGSIGRRYARNDEIGIPFGITIDNQSLIDGSLTLRERDSTKQIRASPTEIVEAIGNMIEGEIDWNSLISRFGEFKN